MAIVCVLHRVEDRQAQLDARSRRESMIVGEATFARLAVGAIVMLVLSTIGGAATTATTKLDVPGRPESFVTFTTTEYDPAEA